MNVLAFGITKEICQAHLLAIEFEGGTTKDLKKALEDRFPRLRQLPSYLIAVNSEYSLNDETIHNGDEIALIHPVSGG